MKKLNKVQQFQLFCLESYRTQHEISGMNALNQFKQFKVLDYLASAYDVLHTQGKNYILADINEYLNHQNEIVSRRHNKN